ncbi:hypothetical protein LTR56_003982 [Elasticomyces elasticus]|nr:hypothetical protein LTR22_026265 [Elasticomyces elasticus]KAK3654352.1 hypothetical protein LTR56_003982 [Elasticomyces elasticus]KAK4928848.1 hypothetical protein LTR49_004349 [Elasticomyces elasticus]KAK5739603.1 hypothetical protein LTS12_025226 [Elasticomyces elasticus]
MAITNPLLALPPELVLRILEFTPLPTLNSLTRSSKAWHDFIDKTHQDAIYTAYNKTYIPNKPGNSPSSFSRYLEGDLSPKLLCERQTLLSQNWNSSNPLTSESVFQVGDDAVWRIRADFQRRFLLSTSLGGGLYVTDMDTGELIWRLPSTLTRTWDSVRPYAHLEYENGTAVFDREGNALEVWRTDVDGLSRGEFKRIAVLPHDCQTRGFHLAGGTLCVVATEGHGFVYDMLQRPPALTRRLEIADEATGHLYQDAEVVMYSMNELGYHFYDKAEGKLLGVLNPGAVPNRCHIEHPSPPPSLGRHGSMSNIPNPPAPGRLVGLSVVEGPVFRAEVMHLEEDEWGAGSLDGNLMVGLSRAGRVFVCPDWRKALQGDYRDCVVVESEYDNTDFDLGGWLSVKDHRIMFEVRDLIYILALDDDNKVQIHVAGDEGAKSRPSYALATSSAPQLSTVPVSFMALFDDCLVSTYATLDWRETDGHIPADQLTQLGPAHGVFPTQTIRIVSFAPEVPARPETMEPATPTKAGTDDLESSEQQTFILPDRTVGTGSTPA